MDWCCPCDAFHTPGDDLLTALWLTCAGAGAFGLVLTQVLQNTVEDLLAIGIASLAGYISVLGLPQKRAAAKEKLQTVAGNFAKVSKWSKSGHQLKTISADGQRFCCSKIFFSTTCISAA